MPRCAVSCSVFPPAIRAAIVIRLRSRGDSPSRFHTSPNSTPSVREASLGAKSPTSFCAPVWVWSSVMSAPRSCRPDRRAAAPGARRWRGVGVVGGKVARAAPSASTSTTLGLVPRVLQPGGTPCQDTLPRWKRCPERPTVEVMDNRSDVRDFLVSRRAKLTPEQAGLSAGTNRRVPGLRRAEAAMLASVSVEYYSRLERGNLSGVSEPVLDAIADAL